MTEAGRSEYVVLLLGSFAYFCFLFVWYVLSAFLTVVIADLGLSSTQAGALTGAIPLVYIPIGLTSGLTIDRIGSRRAIGIGLLVIGVGGAVRSVAAGFPGLLAATLLIGVGGTGITFGLPKLVSDLFPPERSGSMSSIYIVGASLGTAAAFALGRPVMEPALGGWRPAFAVSGAVVAVFALVWIAFTRQLDPADRTGPGEATFSFRSLREDVRRVAGNREMRLLIVIGTMYLLNMNGLTSWIAAVLEARGIAPAVAATLSSLLIVSRIAGTLSIPVVSDYLGRRRAMVVLSGLLGAIGMAGLLLSGAVVWATAVAVAAVGIGIGGLGPMIRALPIELDEVGPRLTATATGLIFTVGEIGGSGGPFLIGALRDLTGTYAAGIGLLCVASLVIVVAGGMMSEPAG